jgi:ubiquinone/menaquinone biosynthesis C-methylase UbiE
MIATKDAAFQRARELSNGRGIVNIGAGPHRTSQAQIIAESPDVVVNIDITANGMPHFIQLDVDNNILPFDDKQFGCAFASHILEHLNNWQFALDEMERVADNVVVVLPHPAYFSCWIHPRHKQHFTLDDIEEMAGLYPNVEVYY